MWIRRAARRLGAIALTVLIGGLLGATLVRLAPGFQADEQELNPQLGEESLRALRQSRAAESNILRFYAGYLGGMLRGDLGISRTLGRPVLELFADRVPVTFRSVAFGWLGGWLLGLALALPAVVYRIPAYDAAATLVSGTFLCLPSALLALLFLLLGAPGRLVIALVVFPRVFRYVRNLLQESYTLPHVLTAQAKGLGMTRTLVWHVLPSAAPQMLALAGVLVGVALSAAIPVEVICDYPGIGQLAWRAALGRDLALLVNLTMLITVITLAANSTSDLAIALWSPDRRSGPQRP